MKNILKSVQRGCCARVSACVGGWLGVFFDLNPDGLLCFNALFGLHVTFYLVVVMEIWVCVCVGH